jgi:hypothetical protein
LFNAGAIVHRLLASSCLFEVVYSPQKSHPATMVRPAWPHPSLSSLASTISSEVLVNEFDVFASLLSPVLCISAADTFLDLVSLA